MSEQSFGEWKPPKQLVRPFEGYAGTPSLERRYNAEDFGTLTLVPEIVVHPLTPTLANTAETATVQESQQVYTVDVFARTVEPMLDAIRNWNERMPPVEQLLSDLRRWSLEVVSSRTTHDAIKTVCEQTPIRTDEILELAKPDPYPPRRRETFITDRQATAALEARLRLIPSLPLNPPFDLEAFEMLVTRHQVHEQIAALGPLSDSQYDRWLKMREQYIKDATVVAETLLDDFQDPLIAAQALRIITADPALILLGDVLP